ncbi:hypothetical protein F4805DRAFT_156221 [Annulohypoxylon moriforme]|nr:hypothetical protein F4805DRAFT_156221 [Annulohypoxylon moriforme]
MAMAPDPGEPQDAWLRDLAYHLSWEIWMQDHAEASETALSQIFESVGGVPDVPPQKVALEAKKKLQLLRMEMLKDEGQFYPDDPDLIKAEDDYEETQTKELKEANKWWKNVFMQKSNDTVAVALCNEEILIAANVKARSYRYISKGGRGKHPVGLYGFFDGRFIETVRQACAAYEQTRGRRIYLLRPEKRPWDVFENAERHAEMQIYGYRREYPKSIKAIGVSKLACRMCRRVMDNNGVRYVDRAFDMFAHPIPPEEVEQLLGKANITNWVHPCVPKFGKVVAERVN